MGKLEVNDMSSVPTVVPAGMVNVPSFWQYVARGALLLFALTSDYIRETRRQKALLEASMKNA